MVSKNEQTYHFFSKSDRIYAMWIFNYKTYQTCHFFKKDKFLQYCNNFWKFGPFKLDIPTSAQNVVVSNPYHNRKHP